MREKLDQRFTANPEKKSDKVSMATPIDKHKLAQLRKDMRKKPNLGVKSSEGLENDDWHNNNGNPKAFNLDDEYFFLL